MRFFALAAFAVAALLFAGTPALAAPAFDPDEAARAWMATIGAEATARSNAYFEGGYWLSLAGTALTVAICWALLRFGLAARTRDFFERTLKIKTLVVLAMALVFLIVLSILTLPFDWYVGFVREHQFGLSTQTFGEWFGEFAIAFALNTVLLSLFVALVYAIVRLAKNAWWLWATAAAACLFAAANFLFPVYVAPLFNTYTAMEEGPLKADILAIAQANGVPADNVYVFDASRQSNRVTANVSGFAGTTRISLADNLITRTSPEAVRAVMGHEIGHYVLGHIYSLMAMFTGLILGFFALVHFSFRAIAKGERYGVRGLSDPAGLPLAVALFAAIGLLTSPIQNSIVRFHEQQADMFGLNAARAPDGFAEAAVLLSEYRKMAPGGLEEILFFDHPSGWNRIRNSMVWKANEIAAGRLAPSPGGPPPGWRPDFVSAER